MKVTREYRRGRRLSQSQMMPVIERVARRILNIFSSEIPFSAKSFSRIIARIKKIRDTCLYQSQSFISALPPQTPSRTIPCVQIMDLLTCGKNRKASQKKIQQETRPRFGYHEKTAVVSVEKSSEMIPLCQYAFVGIFRPFCRRILRYARFDVSIRSISESVSAKYQSQSRIRFIYLLVDRLPIQCRNIENQTELFHSNFGPGLFLL